MWIQRSWSCVELLAFLSTVQIAAGPSYALAVALDGSLYTFGSGSNFCLGHGEQLNEFHPRAILSFKRKGIHLLRVSAGDEHVVALDSNGYVSNHHRRIGFLFPHVLARPLVAFICSYRFSI
ncbi:unnamed protein product [Cuscuta europaea]|uniref:Uncharacterized protein n=1 Tax=Cuscuta europaea TaxID=41803 RepID=A0A9P1EDU2_CUSEU|nr:unnamed protein product [Cuscuta europaea]